MSGTGPLPMESSTANNTKTSENDVLVTSGECCACMCVYFPALDNPHIMHVYVQFGKCWSYPARLKMTDM